MNNLPLNFQKITFLYNKFFIETIKFTYNNHVYMEQKKSINVFYRTNYALLIAQYGYFLTYPGK